MSLVLIAASVTISQSLSMAISAMMSRVTHKALTWLVYFMEEIGAVTALQCGVASRVVPAAALANMTDGHVSALATRSRAALAG